MAAVTRVFESQYFILGPEVKLFEEEVAAKLGARFAVGCASGTDALILSLMAAAIGPGDEVITRLSASLPRLVPSLRWVPGPSSWTSIPSPSTSIPH